MNEELQSTNDELQTINDELQDRTGELDTANGFLETILTSLRAGVVVLSTGLHVQVWNRQAQELWGLRPEEAVGQHFLNLDIGLPTDRLRSLIRRTLADEDGSQEAIVDAVNRRGRTIDVRVLGSALRGDHRRGRRHHPHHGGRRELGRAVSRCARFRCWLTPWRSRTGRTHLRRRRAEILDRIRQLKDRGRRFGEHGRRGATQEEAEQACTRPCAPPRPGGARARRRVPRRGGGGAPARRRAARPARAGRAGPPAPVVGRGGPGGGGGGPGGRRAGGRRAGGAGRSAGG